MFYLNYLAGFSIMLVIIYVAKKLRDKANKNHNYNDCNDNFCFYCKTYHDDNGKKGMAAFSKYICQNCGLIYYSKCKNYFDFKLDESGVYKYMSPCCQSPVTDITNS